MIIVENMEQVIPESATAKLNAKAVTSIVDDVASAARNHWIGLASKDSSSFRADYLNGIQPVKDAGMGVRVIALVGEVPHMLEDGYPQVDLRTLLLGPNVPVVPPGARGKHQNKKGGYYRAIPFRHTTPGAGKTIGQAMGSPYSGHEAVSDAKKLGNAVYRAARKLEAATTSRSGVQHWGGRLDTSRLRAGLAEGQKGVPLLKPHHKSSIYEGMVRLEKTYEKATQSQYMTFRTISTSVKEGWIRGEIQARNYAEKVGQFVQKVLPEAIDAYLEAT